MGALCYQVPHASSSTRAGGGISCPGHSNPLPSKCEGSQETWLLGESHLVSVTPCPSPQALLVTTSLTALK